MIATILVPMCHDQNDNHGQSVVIASQFCHHVIFCHIQTVRTSTVNDDKCDATENTKNDDATAVNS